MSQAILAHFASSSFLEVEVTWLPFVPMIEVMESSRFIQAELDLQRIALSNARACDMEYLALQSLSNHASFPKRLGEYLDLDRIHFTATRSVRKPAFMGKTDMRENIQRMWEESEKGKPPTGRNPYNGWWFYCQGFKTVDELFGTAMADKDIAFNDHARQERTRVYCQELHHLISTPATNSFRALDDSISGLVQFGLDTKEAGSVICERAYNILRRLPLTPQSLEKVHPEFFQNTRWIDFEIVVELASNTIRLALAMSCDTFWGPERPRVSENPQFFRARDDWEARDFQNYINTIGELLEEVTYRLAGCTIREDREGWFIIKCFLWASWQRAMMLVFWYISDHQLKWGYVADRTSLGLRRPCIAPNTSIEKIMESLDEPLRSPYMCPWAYHLLRTNRCSMTMDFRRFHQRFTDLFGKREARCLPGSQVCDGRSPKSCQRFTGANVQGINQSAHNHPCTGQCNKLYWNESSYRSVGSGGRAVSLDSTDGSLLRYTVASDKTLAISHVWNHGQGGRPEHVLVEGEMGGFNSCLHDRYTAIAIRLGCNSYWMDTPCIPEDHELRAESIANINKVFTESKVTLVCDKDLMDIDVSALLDDPDGTTGFLVKLRESIIATVLVCDWNVRSWTLLESMRGRKSIHLLCKNNQTIQLKKVLEMTCEYGSIDIAILFMSSQHMLPALADEPENQYFPARNVLDDTNLGFIRVEEAAYLLSNRHASREGDDIVIWSLLTGHEAYSDAKQLWHAEITTVRSSVRTGFLLSSAPRLIGVKGLQWAPRQPAFHLPATAPPHMRTFPADDGSDTRYGTITEEGLVARWAVCIFELKIGTDPGTMKETILQQIGARVLSHKWGVLMQPIAYGPDYSTRSLVAARYRGSHRYLFGIAGSDDRQEWKWAGVFEWPVEEPLPVFYVETILLV